MVTGPWFLAQTPTAGLSRDTSRFKASENRGDGAISRFFGRAERSSQGSYTAAIARGLDGVLGRAVAAEWDADRDRIAVISDLHRGTDDHADDFRDAAPNYRRALEFYLDAGYGLVLLGDAEELWECWPGGVIATYGELLELEARFHRAAPGRFTKIWGHHDDLWQYPSRVAAHLGRFFGELAVPEALDVTLTRNGADLGRVFLVHGHQGTGPSDRWGGLSRIFVRWVWRPVQRLFKVRLNTPATDFSIRDKHDRAMYEWAAARGDLVLIAGHTHNPVFVSQPHLATLERVRDDLADRAPGTDPAERARRAAEAARDGALAAPSAGTRPSCYFNTGCACFSNGDVTGIELADGEIRLVRWSDGVADPDDRILEARKLTVVFGGLGPGERNP
jgi:hypothetical protein